MPNIAEKRAMVRAYRRRAIKQAILDTLTTVFLVSLSAMGVVVTLFLIQVIVEANR